ncbi:MAG TPA: hydantoinase/oxoprolinase family protein [Solirubrobacterales bacterium]|nr:hydantoinase/oxoprolinase family protein [Solirubrobacterales bacterium]
MRRLGIDIGGTFTDLVLLDTESGAVDRHKVLSTPSDPADGVLEGVRELIEDVSVAPAEIAEVTYATTVATNAVLERRGPRTALLTTAGFRDVLLLQRQIRYDLFDLNVDKATPLLRRRDIHEVRERLTVDGGVDTPLDEDGLRRLVELLAADGVRSLAIAFLHAYRHDAHERRAAELIAEVAPELHLSLSSVVAPVIGEYERTNTTVVDAYVRPVVIEHLEDLATRLRDLGVGGEVRVMLSDGGVTSIARAARTPVRMIESGPAAGAKMGAIVGAATGEANVIAFDMGGTTAKVALIEEGRPTTGEELEIDRAEMTSGSGLPLAIPSIDLIEIGSGGGSVARAEGAILRVGPQSAGASPGPACYGLGGTDATSTDADLALGYLSPDYFLGGRLVLDPEAAREALRRNVCEPLGLEIEDGARGVYEVVNSNMAAAIRAGTIQRGRDPRQYALVATGGAAPMHAVALARSLGIPRVVCPAVSGVASAYGLLAAENGTTFVRSSLLDVDARLPERAEREFEALTAECEEALAVETAAAKGAIFHRAVSVRYRGQGYDLKIELPERGDLDPDLLAADFYTAYEQLYGRSDPGPLEVTRWHLEAILWVPEMPATAGAAPRAVDPETATVPPERLRRRLYDPSLDRWVEGRVWRQDQLPRAATLVGPGALEQPESTLVFFTGDAVAIDAAGNVVVTLGDQVLTDLLSPREPVPGAIAQSPDRRR